MTNPSLLSSSGSIVEVSSSALAAQDPALKPGEYPFKRGQLRVPSAFFCVFFYTCMIFSSHLNCFLHCSTRPQDPQSKPEEKCELSSTCRYSKETSIGFMNFGELVLIRFSMCILSSETNVIYQVLYLGSLTLGFTFVICQYTICLLCFFTQKSYFPQNQS